MPMWTSVSLCCLSPDNKDHYRNKKSINDNDVAQIIILNIDRIVFRVHSRGRQMIFKQKSNLLCRGKKLVFVQWYFPNSCRSSRHFQIDCNSYNVQQWLDFTVQNMKQRLLFTKLFGSMLLPRYTDAPSRLVLNDEPRQWPHHLTYLTYCRGDDDGVLALKQPT